MPTRVTNNGGVEAGGVFVEKRVVFKDVENKEENGLVKKLFIQNISNYSDDSSSSIGKNSDLSENLMEKSGDGEEVQSSYNKGALDAMGGLEEVLPIRRGISSFYNGKSKSYTSLAEASSSSSSIKDIAKQDNPYTRKRRNLLSCSINWDSKNRNSCLKSNGGGISKRSNSSTRTTLALGVAMSNSDRDEKDEECDSNGSSLLVSESPGTDFSPWRSISLADLQHCACVAKTCENTNSNC